MVVHGMFDPSTLTSFSTIRSKKGNFGFGCMVEHSLNLWQTLQGAILELWKPWFRTVSIPQSNVTKVNVVAKVGCFRAWMERIKRKNLTILVLIGLLLPMNVKKGSAGPTPKLQMMHSFRLIAHFSASCHASATLETKNWMWGSLANRDTSHDDWAACSTRLQMCQVEMKVFPRPMLPILCQRLVAFGLGLLLSTLPKHLHTQ
jgi:hypothetical protein